MASGLPDYYRGVDIAYQALAQMIVRPKYGGAIRTAGSVTVTAMWETLLCAVSGKGMIYGGWIRVAYTSTQKNSGLLMKIDGEYASTMSFAGANKYGTKHPRTHPMTLQKFDDTGFVYAVGISYGVTFETGVELFYQDEHGTTPPVGYSLIYTLI